MTPDGSKKIRSDALKPFRRQAVAWTNADLLLIIPLETIAKYESNYAKFCPMKIHLKMPYAKKVHGEADCVLVILYIEW